MPQISQAKKDKIQEQILFYLYSISPKSVFTNTIAQEIARDEEFTKTLLTDLKSKSLVLEVTKNSKGKDYLKRKRWSISSNAFRVYSQHQ